ncbi:hypothetical protein S40285_06389 [Stachybotrys chlorohalonatus IBT 40285]|uniref:Alkyl hydroperoxide reductase subunit C/ Thiol specific antioxidant domain-containing protein n=1 Tax=Stachybotrys chlorohalonatus (strain IBT 40285) TaxID=1283841 RepID=A0A084QGG3_STAC4|nr:hypothetical protein S40285_06389 [Stachybotrys chlorohalonata IBT 40285]
MFSGLATKIALKKAGLPTDSLNFFDSPSQSSTKNAPTSPAENNDDNGGWGSWMTMKALPLTVHPWLTPPPPSVAVGRPLHIGDSAPRDRDRKLLLGGGRRVLVVFLRCVGCAFAQKTFLNLRAIANRYAGSIHCVAVSHSSQQATKKWIDLMGGAWTVQVVIDEDRSIYAAWGLGVGSMWYVFNPTTQMQGWKETGWLGEKVAGAIQRKGNQTKAPTANEDDDDAVNMTMGNKWQEAGAFAVDGKGTVIWGGKALRADDVMNLDEGAALLNL